MPDKHNQRYGLIVGEVEQNVMLSAVTKAKKVFEFKGQLIQKD